MKPHIGTHGADIVKQVGCVYAFELREKKGGAPTTYTIDLKNGSGAIHEGKVEGVKADATFVMLDADFIKLTQGKLKAQDAFMQVSIFIQNRQELIYSKKLYYVGQDENQRKHESCLETQARYFPKRCQDVRMLKISR